MVTPTNGTATFKGLQTGTFYPIDFYISDVVAAPCTFSQQGKAGTGNLAYTTFKEDVALVDLSIATGPTVMVGLSPTSDENLVPGAAVRIANFLNTLAFRPALNIGFKTGRRISLVQF